MKFRVIAITVVLVLFLFSGGVFGADTDAVIDGKWRGKYRSGTGDVREQEFIFKSYGKELRGTTIGGENGERLPISNGKIDGKKISFTVVISFQGRPMIFLYTGELNKDKLRLRFETGSVVGTGTNNKGQPVVSLGGLGNGSFTVDRVKGENVDIAANLSAQDGGDYESERRRALDLIKDYNPTEAGPILEKLLTIKPDDAEVIEAFAFTTMAGLTTENDPEKRRDIILRTRALAERAMKLGRNSSLVRTLLDELPPDGKEPLTGMLASETSPGTPALMEGEVAFQAGKLDQAIKHYERAAQLDPNLYEAPLFIGDVYYKMKEYGKAYEYYARAVAINPDRDTAYRFWGDVLIKDNKLAEAKDKLIEAFIAEPYARLTRQYLSGWADISKIQLGHPQIDIPDLVLSKPLSADKDGSSAWASYIRSRDEWRSNNNSKFFEAFPNEKVYRHSLREEYQALSLVAESVEAQLKQGELKESDLNKSIANLLKLHREGLLEAYILLVKPDDGIVRDYPEYRANNREKLRRYMNEYVTAAK